MSNWSKLNQYLAFSIIQKQKLRFCYCASKTIVGRTSLGSAGNNVSYKTYKQYHHYEMFWEIPEHKEGGLNIGSYIVFYILSCVSNW